MNVKLFEDRQSFLALAPKFVLAIVVAFESTFRLAFVFELVVLSVFKFIILFTFICVRIVKCSFSLAFAIVLEFHLRHEKQSDKLLYTIKKDMNKI